jgi:signal transduction histidine kinase
MRNFTQSQSDSRIVFLYGTSPEPLINIGRLIISIFGLVAIYIDPTQPQSLVGTSYDILGGYVLYSLLLIPSYGTIFSPSMTYMIITTSIDVLIVGVLSYITGELESPFLTFFTFLLISSAIRWNVNGTIATASALQVILVLVAIPDLSDGDSQANFLIIRSVFCWVIVLMLGYFGAYRNRSLNRLRDLASWPHEIVPDEGRPWLTSSLRHAAKVLGAKRIVVRWRDLDTEAIHVAIFENGSCSFIDDDQGNVDSLNNRYCITRHDGNRIIPDQVVFDKNSTLGICKVFSSKFSSLRFDGEVAVFDPDFKDRDTILLSKIVASRIAIELEQYALVKDYISSIELQGRLKMARDIHDGVLQSLTAAVIQISTQLGSNDTVPRECVLSVKDAIREAQTRIRRQISSEPAAEGGAVPLFERVERFLIALERQWACKISAEIPTDLLVDDAMATELCLSMSEAIANAVRHGKANQIAMKVECRADALRITIDDNGTGGNGVEAPLPRSIASRVSDLGGELRVVRLARGLSLRIALPTNAERTL